MKADVGVKVCWGMHVGATGVEWGSEVDVEESADGSLVSCVVMVMSGSSDGMGLTRTGKDPCRGR